MTDTELDPVAKLHKDARQAFMELDEGQVRFIVDMYYSLQEQRKALRNQERALIEANEPVTVVQHFGDQVEQLEKQVVPIMNRWTDTQKVGRWSKAQKGIGPVIAAGLLAHIDISKAQTAGAIWRYAGLDPTQEWGKGEKRPWNAKLKVLCWKIGDSFVKVSNHSDSFYGQLYKSRKEQEVEKNNSQEFSAQAEHQLASKNIKSAQLKGWLEQGMLSPAHIDQRAKRYTTKIFLSHWFEVAYRDFHGEEPPRPFAIEHLGHAHKIEPPALDTE